MYAIRSYYGYVNGVAEANPGKTVFMFGSDGSQQEGDDAEAARYAVARKLNLTLLLDDNDVTIAGHPTDYMQGYDLVNTLSGQGLAVQTCAGEDVDALYSCIRQSIATEGPAAVVIRRKMARITSYNVCYTKLLRRQVVNDTCNILKTLFPKG